MGSACPGLACISVSKLSIASANSLVHVVTEQHPFIETISALCFAHVIFKFSAAFSVASTGEDPRVDA